MSDLASDDADVVDVAVGSWSSTRLDIGLAAGALVAESVLVEAILLEAEAEELLSIAFMKVP